MGKYIKKSRPADVAVMDGALGVRTRAKTLALLQQQSSKLSSLRKTSSAVAATEALLESSGYLELRNRKLAKVPRTCIRAQAAAGGVANSGFEVPAPALSLKEETPGTHGSSAAAAPDRKDTNASVSNRQEPAARLSGALRASHSDSCLNQRLCVPLSRPAQSASNSASVASIRSTDPAAESSHTGQSMNVEVAEAAAAAATCCGDNAGVLCEKESSSSQGATTSCTFEDVSVRAGAAGSSSTQQQHQQRRIMRPTTTGCCPAWRHKSPASEEIDDFFAEVEEQNEQDRRRFLAKYNFDVVKDVPLPGRFEWVQLHSAT